MKLDDERLARLSIAYRPVDFLRAMPAVYRGTPLGMGYGSSRFACPDRTFKLLYIAEDLATCLAETLIRDRFEDRMRRRITEAEARSWCVAAVDSTTALTLIDLRTTGFLRLGVSTDAGRAKRQHRGRRLSHAIHEQTAADGVVYASRLTNATCCAIYERGVTKLAARRVEDLVTLKAFVPALASLDIALVATS